MGSAYGESEKKLRELFEEAAKSAPSIIFIDEIDSIAPKRGQVSGEAEKRLVAQLLTLMDGIEPRQNLVVIAATNRPEAIDEALRRPGRFDREIVVGVPDQNGRREILGIHTRGMPLAEGVNLDDLAKRTYGFVGADLAALTREAALEAVRRILPKINLEDSTIPTEILDALSVDTADFENAIKRVQPSAMREVMVQVPDVTWDDVGGLDAARDKLREGIELPLKHPDAFRRLGIRPAKGFLLYGPPGTGKTMLAKACARESQANFISIKSSDLLSKWYGESEQQIARLFARARQVAPTVIFIDELDSLVPARGGGMGEPQVTERVVNTILAEMDGLEELNNVVLIGATNRPNLIDPALLRPGRFDELIFVGVPDEAGRKRILSIHTSGMPLAKDVDLDALARRAERFTGADLEDLTRRAGLTALRRGLDSAEVTMADFEAALVETRASVTDDMLADYERIQDTLKSDAVRPTGGIGFVSPGMLQPRAPAKGAPAAPEAERALSGERGGAQRALPPQDQPDEQGARHGERPVRVDRVERHADGRRGDVGDAVGGGDDPRDPALLGERDGEAGAAGEARAGEAEAEAGHPEAEHQPVEIDREHRQHGADRGDRRAPQDHRARAEAQLGDQAPLRGERGRRPRHHHDRDRLLRPARREREAVDDEKAEAGQHRRLGMTRDDPGDDPVADAAVVPLELGDARRGRGDDAGPGRRGGERGIAHRRAMPAPLAVARANVVGQPDDDRDEHHERDQREGEQRTGQPDEGEDEQRRERRADDRAEPEAGRQRRQGA